MAQLVVRRLDPAVVMELRRRAARSGRSMEAEHREILAMMRERDYAGLEEVIRRHNRDALTAYSAHHRAATAATPS